MFVKSSLMKDMNQKMQDGSIALQLLLPTEFRKYQLMIRLSDNLLLSVYKTLPPVVVALIFFGLRFEFTFLRFISYIITLLFAFYLNFAYSFILGLSVVLFKNAFFLENVDELIFKVLSGAIVPFWFFPMWLNQLSYILPFRYMIYEPMAAAIGIGLDVQAPEGNMIVDIGGGTTEIAVISLGGIVSNNSIRVAGDDLTNDIQEYMGRQHNVKVGERTAELIKINVGSALTELDNPPEDYVVHGPNRMTALPMEVPISYQEIAHCIEKSISKIEAAVLNALEHTPPELYADIVRNGIWLAGGGALLRGLDKRLTDKIGIPFHIAEDPLHAVAKGTGVALKNIDQFSFLIR